MDDFIIIKIVDDGHGMDMENLDRKSGLRNMEERAKRVGADFNIISEINKGTEVCLKLQSVS